ncbi:MULTISPECIES: CheR family methyltransferase [Pseudomonas]|uniref:CheR family methyltransferase n=1 Tax=Pseudomonas TaxID=286 RepID=UPI00132F23ED|nr:MULTISPECIES: CheR family methyltransferase [Pseudomonas]QHF30825.1 protein-glutamate O-methyltransferase [Pseudomonas sp. R32]UVL29263.1 methyltransferase domain-containing protein [Pseudomonas donghuensis]
MPADNRPPMLSEAQFLRFRTLVSQRSGVFLAADRRAAVAARLGKRLRHLQLTSFEQYLQLIEQPDQHQEQQQVLDLLIARDTYFFREHRHFECLAQWLRDMPRPLRLWSAACASGEEAYSLAMVASEHAVNDDWSVLASDISPHLLQQAAEGIYDVSQARYFPEGWLQRYCLCGVGEMAGRMRMAATLQERLTFRQINLIQPLPADLGLFDGIFLRNLLTYFSQDEKQRVVQRLLACLRPGGLLLIGHSENIHGLDLPLRPILPSVFERL